MAKSYSSFVTSPKNATPMNQPIPGYEKEMVPNSSGAMSFHLDHWKQLDRFLILGACGPTYYASQKELVKQNYTEILNAINENGVRVVNRVVEISQAGRAPKNEPALFVLALVMAKGSLEARQAACAAVNSVARIGTHLFALVGYLKDFNAFNGAKGRYNKQAVAKWFTERKAENLAHQVIKYRQRNGWSMENVAKIVHPGVSKDDSDRLSVLNYVRKGWENVGTEPHPVPALQPIWAFERAKSLTDASEIAKLVTDYKLPWEALDTKWLNTHEVWEALINDIKPEALMRNLARLTSNGFLQPLNKYVNLVCEKLTDEESLKAARLHPLKLLAALRTYQKGHGDKGSLSWNPIPKISAALEDGFYKAFGAITPANKNVLLALDVSGSMGCGNVAGISSLTPRECSAVMAMVAARTEPNYDIVGFANDLIRLNINHKMSLNDVITKISNIPFGSTNIAAPFEWARKNKVEAHGIFVYTDCEFNTGGHPWEALKRYRKEVGIDAKLVTVGMTANNFAIAPQCEPNTALDVVGFDAGAPEIMNSFLRNEL